MHVNPRKAKKLVDRQKQTDRQTDVQKERQAERQTDRRTEIQEASGTNRKTFEIPRNYKNGSPHITVGGTAISARRHLHFNEAIHQERRRARKVKVNYL